MDSPDSEQRIAAAFAEAYPAIQRALLNYYCLGGEEAEALEFDLCLWFHRLLRRDALGRMPVVDARYQLLLTACRSARKLQSGRADLTASGEHLKAVLAREPEHVAFEILHPAPDRESQP